MLRCDKNLDVDFSSQLFRQQLCSSAVDVALHWMLSFSRVHWSENFETRHAIKVASFFFHFDCEMTEQSLLVARMLLAWPSHRPLSSRSSTRREGRRSRRSEPGLSGNESTSSGSGRRKRSWDRNENDSNRNWRSWAVMTASPLDVSSEAGHCGPPPLPPTPAPFVSSTCQARSL